MTDMPIVSRAEAAADASSTVGIVVVDPRFDAYKSLATAAKLGRCTLHFRGSGRAALQLLSKRRVEAVIVGPALDDMAGHEFVALLQTHLADTPPGAGVPMVLMASAAVDPQAAADPAWLASGCAGTLSHPITTMDVEDRLRGRHRRGRNADRVAGLLRAMATLPVGVSVAVITIAALLLR